MKEYDPTDPDLYSYKEAKSYYSTDYNGPTNPDINETQFQHQNTMEGNREIFNG